MTITAKMFIPKMESTNMAYFKAIIKGEKSMLEQSATKHCDIKRLDEFKVESALAQAQSDPVFGSTAQSTGLLAPRRRRSTETSCGQFSPRLLQVTCNRLWTMRTLRESK